MKDISLSKILQDVSALFGSLLPIAQLFFSQWAVAFNSVFIAKESFVGISIITLILSYIFIIAFLTAPYIEILLPFQKKKQKKLQEHWQKQNYLQQKINTLVSLPNVKPRIITEAYDNLMNSKQPENPLKIDSQNQVPVVVCSIVFVAVIFVVLAFVPNPSWLIAGMQSLAYILLIAFSALMLTIYKRISDNNANYKDNQRSRTEKAIKLAIDANGFGDLPQVTFVNQQQIDGYGGNLSVTVSYKDEQYEIVTDDSAEYLVAMRKNVG